MNITLSLSPQTGLSSHDLNRPKQDGSSSSSSSSNVGSNERILPPYRPSYKPSHALGNLGQSMEEKAKIGESQCAIGHVYMTSIPAGQTNVDHIDPYMISDGSSIEECASQCCKDPQLYQYAWIITAKCFCVGCDPLNKEKCAPMSLKTLTDSTYALLNTYTPSKISNSKIGTLVDRA